MGGLRRWWVVASVMTLVACTPATEEGGAAGAAPPNSAVSALADQEPRALPSSAPSALAEHELGAPAGSGASNVADAAGGDDAASSEPLTYFELTYSRGAVGPSYRRTSVMTYTPGSIKRHVTQGSKESESTREVNAAQAAKLDQAFTARGLHAQPGKEGTPCAGASSYRLEFARGDQPRTKLSATSCGDHGTLAGDVKGFEADIKKLFGWGP